MKNRKLVTKRKDLRLQGGTGSKTGGHQSEKSDEKRAHRGSHHDLTNDRNLCVFRWDGVFGNHNGAAGAIDWYGRKFGLPPSLSGHQTWFLWDPRGYSGNCLIVLDDSRKKLESMYDQVEFVGNSPDNPYALEKNLPSFHL